MVATSTLQVSCPGQREWSLGLGNGLHPGTGIRRMAGAEGYVSYELYRDAARTQTWGDTTGDRYDGASGAAGEAVTVTVYGRVPAQDEVPPGPYSDTVVATLYY